MSKPNSQTAVTLAFSLILSFGRAQAEDTQPCYRFLRQLNAAQIVQAYAYQQCLMPDGKVHGWQIAPALMVLTSEKQIEKQLHDDLTKLDEDYRFIESPGCDPLETTCQELIYDCTDDGNRLQEEIGAIRYMQWTKREEGR